MGTFYSASKGAIATGTTFALAGTGLLAFPSLASADATYCGDSNATVVAGSGSDQICQVVLDTPGSDSWTPPSGKTLSDLELILVGGGGGLGDDPNEPYDAYGGGGQVTFITNLASDSEIQVQIGSAGTTGVDGGLTSVTQGSLSGYAMGGKSNGTSYAYGENFSSQAEASSTAFTVGPGYLTGSGTAGPAQEAFNGTPGPGIVPSVAGIGNLWPTLSGEETYGMGGGSSPTSATNYGLGQYGSVNDAIGGAVIIRYKIGTESSDPGPSPAPAAEYGVDYFITPPMVQGSYLLGETGTYSVDFNNETPDDPCPASVAGGKILISGACIVKAGGQYGGAITTSTSREVNQSPSVFATTNSDSDPLIDKRVIFNFTEDMKYLGFWWSAGSPTNFVTFYDGDDVVLQLTTEQLFDVFGEAPTGAAGNYGSTGNLTVDSIDYPKHYYFGHPKGYTSTTPSERSTGLSAPTEPFVYVHIFTKNSTSFDRVELSGGGFEFDNFVISSQVFTPDTSKLYPVGSISPTVSFDANGGTGTMTDQTSSTETALDANTFEFEGFIFDGWNTKADGTGTPYADEGLYPFSSGTTLYAQWRGPSNSFSSPSPYQGPVITDVGADNTVSPFPTSIGNNVRVLGQNLSGVSSVLVNGIEAELVSGSENSFVFTVPEGLESGTYDLTVVSGGQNVQVQEPLVVGDGLSIEEAAAICDGQAPTVWTQRISVTQAKAYIKCGTPGVSYRVSVQQNGSGPYDTVITRTLSDIYDERQLFNTVGRYVVRTIDLTERTRIRIYSDEEKLWQVVYNKDSFGG